jgi:hypothetical protein
MLNCSPNPTPFSPLIYFALFQISQMAIGRFLTLIAFAMGAVHLANAGPIPAPTTSCSDGDIQEAVRKLKHIAESYLQPFLAPDRISFYHAREWLNINPASSRSFCTTTSRKKWHSRFGIQTSTLSKF